MSGILQAPDRPRGSASSFVWATIVLKLKPAYQNIKKWLTLKSPHRLAVLVSNPFFSELTVNVGPEKKPVYACRAILGISSPYFEDLLYGPNAITGNDVDIPNVDPEIFRIFLEVNVLNVLL